MLIANRSFTNDTGCAFWRNSARDPGRARACSSGGHRAAILGTPAVAPARPTKKEPRRPKPSGALTLFYTRWKCRDLQEVEMPHLCGLAFGRRRSFVAGACKHDIALLEHRFILFRWRSAPNDGPSPRSTPYLAAPSHALPFAIRLLLKMRERRGHRPFDTGLQNPTLALVKELHFAFGAHVLTLS